LGFGLLWGNAIAIVLCYLQDKFNIIPLNPENYFVSFVPIQFDVVNILIINVGTIVISIAILLIPSYFVAKKINAIDALKME
jgi:lipoprotein-releasing system permease protein